jgi:hypothetical protein
VWQGYLCLIGIPLGNKQSPTVFLKALSMGFLSGQFEKEVRQSIDEPENAGIHRIGFVQGNQTPFRAASDCPDDLAQGADLVAAG